MSKIVWIFFIDLLLKIKIFTLNFLLIPLIGDLLLLLVSLLFKFSSWDLILKLYSVCLSDNFSSSSFISFCKSRKFFFNFSYSLSLLSMILLKSISLSPFESSTSSIKLFVVLISYFNFSFSIFNISNKLLIVEISLT